MIRRRNAEAIAVPDFRSSYPPKILADTGFSAEAFREREAEARDAAMTGTKCLFCSWTFTGTALECRMQAKLHRERKHPEAKQSSRRKLRKAHSWKQNTLTEQDHIEVEDERRKRMHLLGID